jgi:RNase P/RNase MRP subunit p30
LQRVQEPVLALERVLGPALRERQQQQVRALAEARQL